MPAPVIRKLPTPPNRQNAPAVFAERADAMVSALPGMVDDMNASAEFVDERAATAEASAQAAASSRNAAQQAATNASTNGAAQVQLAKGHADAAAGSATSAEGSRQGAEALLAAVGSAAGLPSLEDAQGKALTATPDGVAWSNEFSRYTLASVAATAILDLAKQQVFRIDASLPRTLSLANAPSAGRAMTVVLHITGKSAIAWPASIVWDEDEAPELGDTFTRVLLIWDGVSWTGSVGAAR